ncbi:dehydrogenase [Flavimobilis marinus]|uniref:Predicted dehydrogenase n=1 Tax=Flavimobilis marinus TaxID=285351 RepID=A0A1I2HHV7_9MICO|nr:Gfo/Idh/MocA family oxidoreductase [Flavimobilis marinus]GHG57697.1 dehydrogenase [Flavimobilis marinus]SFF28467.1 Predicted dehydrogenase [Flavimobilis marinus]
MAALRAGLIGLGAMGRHHARVLREMDGVDLVAVADPGGDPFRVAGPLEVLRDVEALIAAGIDMAVVAVPTAFHEPVAVALAEAGVHTLVEKPIALDVPAGERVRDAFGRAGLVGCIGHIERFNPAIQEVRRRVAAGELGEVYQIVTRRQGPFPARIADVGVIKDLATHDIDSTAWVAGAAYDSVSAQTAFRSGRSHEDMVLATGRLADGVIVNHVVNWLSPMKERITIVTGERGALTADTSSGDVTFYANGTVATEWESVASFRGVSEGDVIRYAIAKREPLRNELEAFRDAVLGEENRTVTMAEGLTTLRVAEAMLASAADRGRTVSL